MRQSITEKIELKYAKPTLWAQIVFLLLPFVLTPVILYLVKLALGKKEALELFSLGILSFFGFGKFIVFAPLIPMKGIDFKITYTPFGLATMVWYMDTMTAIFVAYNAHVLNKLYWIGPKFKQIRKDCYFLQQGNKWMKKIASLAVILFVCFPVAGTGAIGGAFLGIMLGLSRIYTVFLIWVGAIVGSFGMACGAIFFESKFKNFLENPVVFYSMLSILVLLLVLASLQIKKSIQKQKKLEGY